MFLAHTVHRRSSQARRYCPLSSLARRVTMSALQLVRALAGASVQVPLEAGGRLPRPESRWPFLHVCLVPGAQAAQAPAPAPASVRGETRWASWEVTRTLGKLGVHLGSPLPTGEAVTQGPLGAVLGWAGLARVLWLEWNPSAGPSSPGFSVSVPQGCLQPHRQFWGLHRGSCLWTVASCPSCEGD